MYAVVEINGKQYHAEAGKTLTVDRIDDVAGAAVSFSTVVLVAGDNGVRVGTPYVEGVSINAVVDEEVKADKVIVFKYKPKKDYRRTRGHRQKYTVITVKEIVGA